jgi:hypothetical protein
VKRLVVATVVALAAPAAASPAVDLRARTLPGPRDLRMRKDVAQVPGDDAVPEPAGAGELPDGPDPLTWVRRPRDDADVAPLSERLVVRIDLGIGVDGARTSQRPTFDGVRPDAVATVYDSVRSYGFGEVYLGSRGVGAASLSTYLAAQTRIATPIETARPILSVYDEVSDYQVRSAWIESDDLFERRWLAPLRARAGRMFVYGPAVVHLDGLVVAWESSWFEVSTYSGARVPAFVSLELAGLEPGEQYDRGGVVSGSELRVDLRRFDLPIVLGTSTLRYLTHDHADLQASIVPRKDVVIRSTTRFQDGALARQRLLVRARVSEVTTVIVDNLLRTEADWFWDHASIAASPPERRSVELDAAARRYLDLGPVRPRFQTAVQAGTVIAQNVDLLARGAIALDVDRDPGAEDADLNPHLPEYIEGGAGIEVRLRRALGLQATFLIRDYQRPQPGDDEVIDVPDTPQPFPVRAALGEEYLVEGGVAARYTLGARRFSGQGELYLRQTRWAGAYADASDLLDITFVDRHGGGRFWLEAWVNPRVRLRGEYDISTLLELSPEFRGLKTLRLLLEGTY